MPKDIKPVKIEPATPTKSGLGRLVESTLVRFGQRVIDSTAETLSEIIEAGIEIFLEAIEEALIDVNRDMIERVIANLPPDSPVIPYLRALIEKESLAGAISLAGFAGSMGTSAAGSLLTILLRPLGYEVDSLLHTARFDPTAAIAAAWRQAMSWEDVYDQLQDLGWSVGAIEIWKTLLKPVLDEGDNLQLWVRGEIDEGELRHRLTIRGYDDPTISNMQALTQPLLGHTDLRSLYLRGHLTSGELAEELQRYGYSAEQIEHITTLVWQLVAPGDIVELSKRGVLTIYETTERLKQHGYTDEAIAEILEVGRPLTGTGDLASLYYRGNLSLEDFRQRIGQYGYQPTQIDEIVALLERIPGPADLISMAVREAFRPEVIERYEYLAEFPEVFAEFMEKQGYKREWAERYWVAHWALPSITMAYEMFHRRIITLEDIELLLATADIAPYWRPKLIQAAYAPLTRVDVRRMFELGVLDREAVYNSYLDLGYSPENAEAMTLFTERYEAGAEREASKADILKGYSLGIFTHDEAAAQLVGINYTPDWAEYYIILEDLKRAESLLKQEVSLLQDQYIEGFIDRSDVFVALGEWDLPSKQVEMYLEEWDIAKRRKVALPSTGQLEGFLKQGIISEDEYHVQLRKRHYDATAIAWFLQEIRLQMAEKALEEEERARKEAQRVEEAEVKTAYDVARADIDVQIAELKTALAENKVLLGVVVDIETMEALFRQNDEINLAIVRLNQRKAETKLELTETLRGMRA